MRASVIDLGYNSLKMVSYEVGADGSFQAFSQRGQLTKLGEGLHANGLLGREPVERTIRVLKLFNEVNGLLGVRHVLAVATSPVRDAHNGPDFLRRAEIETGLSFRKLSGGEEALFSYIGAAQAVQPRTILFFDLGGGSLELIYAKDFRVRKIISLPLGALRLSELYRTDGQKKFAKKEYGRMRRRLAQLIPTSDDLELDEDTVLVGVGGTVRALARYDQWMNDYPLYKIHNYVLRREAVMNTHKRLRKMTTHKISTIDAFGKDRAQSMTAGSLVVGALMNSLGFDELVVSTHGLRDGILSLYLRDPAGYHKGELTYSIANRLLRDLRNRRPKSSELVKSFYTHSIVTAREQVILDEACAGFLGLFRNTRAESLFHSVLNQDSALSHEDQIALGLALVRAKAPKAASWLYGGYRSMLWEGSKESIATMAGIIQLEEILRLANATGRLRLRGSEVVLEITSAKEGGFPNLVLADALKALETTTGRIISVRIHQKA